MINMEQNAQLLISGFTQREIHIQKRKFYNLFNVDPFLTPLHRKDGWADLTDDEYFALQMKIKKPMISVQDYIDAMRMVAQALKEKNT